MRKSKYYYLQEIKNNQIFKNYFCFKIKKKNI